MQVRPEQPGEEQAISDLIAAAFAGAEHSDGTEGSIVGALRAADALSVSLVATVGGRLVGHVAFSPVAIDGRDERWFGLGPVAVAPKFQARGYGTALVKEGIKVLRSRGANGCVVLGEPRFYSRFGFAADPKLWLADVPPGYFQSVTLHGERPRGQVRYHAAFGVA